MRAASLTTQTQPMAPLTPPEWVGRWSFPPGDRCGESTQRETERDRERPRETERDRERMIEDERKCKRAQESAGKRRESERAGTGKRAQERARLRCRARCRVTSIRREQGGRAERMDTRNCQRTVCEEATREAPCPCQPLACKCVCVCRGQCEREHVIG
jgi:hypothetical protein